MGPYLSTGTTRVGLRKTPIPPKDGVSAGACVAVCPGKVGGGGGGRSQAGYGGRATLQGVERERDRDDIQGALGRYMGDREKDTHLQCAADGQDTTGTVAELGVGRKMISRSKYPAGGRMARAGRMMAMGNTPRRAKGARMQGC